MARRAVVDRRVEAFQDFADSRPVVTVYSGARAGRSVYVGSIVRYFPGADETPEQTAQAVEELKRAGAAAVRVQPREAARKNLTEGRETEAEESTKQVPVREALVSASANVRGIDTAELTSFVLAIADEVAL